MKILLLTAIGLAALCVLFEGTTASTVTCPHCVCPPSYSPVCGFQASTMKTRGFSSRCVLECSNKCRKNKFEFVFNGRCGKWKPTSTTTEAPPSTDIRMQDSNGLQDVSSMKR